MPQRLLGVEQGEKICTEAKSSATQAQPIILQKNGYYYLIFLSRANNKITQHRRSFAPTQSSEKIVQQSNLIF